MTGNVNRLVKMRPASLPFTDSFPRADGSPEDTTHPWYAPVTAEGRRLEIVSGKLAIPARTLGKTWLKLPATTFDLTFRFALGNGSNGSAGDLQVQLFAYDPTEDPSAPANSYLFAAGTSVAGYTLYRTPPAVSYYSGGGALAFGGTYLCRLRYDGTSIALLIDGVLKFSETAYFTPDSRQLAVAFISDDESNWFDDVSITTPAPLAPVLLDDFHRADATPATPSPQGFAYTSPFGTTARISSNHLGGAAADWVAVTNLGGTPGDFDWTYQFVTGTPPSGATDFIDLYFRVQDANNRCFVELASGGIALYTYVAGSLATIRSVSQSSYTGTAGQTHTLEVKGVGNAITVYLDGSLMISATVTALASATGVGVHQFSPSGYGTLLRAT